MKKKILTPTNIFLNIKCQISNVNYFQFRRLYGWCLQENSVSWGEGFAFGTKRWAVAFICTDALSTLNSALSLFILLYVSRAIGRVYTKCNFDINTKMYNSIHSQEDFDRSKVYENTFSLINKSKSSPLSVPHGAYSFENMVQIINRLCYVNNNFTKTNK